MEETNDQVVQLINQASILTDKDAKLNLLQQIQELTVNKQPELLDNFFEEILQFQLDPAPPIRQHVLAFLETACKKDAGLLLKAVPTLNMLLHDDSPAVKKRAVLANTNLYQPVLKEVASPKPKVRAPEELWAAMKAIKDIIRGMISDSNTGVRTAVLKFLELQILAQSLKTTDSETKKSADGGLEIVPLRHPILDVAVLRADGRESFELLIAQLDDKGATGVSIQNTVASLCSIARLRPTFMERVIVTMVKLIQTPPSQLSENHVKNIRRKLKGTLVTLLKHPASAEFHEQLIPVLEELEVPYTTINEFDMRGKVRDRAAATKDEPLMGRVESDVAAAPAKRRRLDPMADYERIKRELPFPLLVELLMISMGNLPDTMQRVASGQPPFDAGVAAAAHAGGTLAPVPAVMPMAPSIVRKREADGPDLAADRKHKKPYKLTATAFPDDAGSQMTVGAFRRILSLEGRMTEGGAKRNRVLLIARLVSLLEEPKLADELITFVLKAPKDRKELALVWLYHQHQRIITLGAIPEKKKRAIERYDHCVERLLAGLKVNLDSKDKLIMQLLVQIPRFTLGALEMVKAYCEDDKRNTIGFLSLRELIKDRPPVRGQCLPVLLGYTRSTDLTVRTRAIRVCKKLGEVPSLYEPIQAFAFDGIARLTEVPASELISADPEEDGDWSPETVQVHLYLYFDLVMSNPQLLKKLINSYPNIQSADVRRVARQTLRNQLFGKAKDPSARTIDWTDRTLLGMLVDHQPGSEDLIVHLLHSLTDSDSGKPHQSLLATVRKIHDKNPKDSRFLIPILQGLSKTEVISALPSLLALKDIIVTQVIDRILGTRPGALANIGASALSPSELLVVLHAPNIPAKDAMKALNKCFERKRVYTSEVLAVALQQLVDQTPLPMLFMRTAMLALNTAPKLKGFIVGLLTRLLSKKIWKDARIWKGFVKCCGRTTPQSLDIVLQLPLTERASAFVIEPALRDRLVVHLKKMTLQQRSTVQANVFEQLGVSSETGLPVKATSSN